MIDKQDEAAEKEKQNYRRRPLEPEEIERWRDMNDQFDRYVWAIGLLSRIIGWGAGAWFAIWASRDTLAKIWKAVTS